MLARPVGAAGGPVQQAVRVLLPRLRVAAVAAAAPARRAHLVPAEYDTVVQGDYGGQRLDFVDFDMGGPPVCQFSTMPSLNNFHLPKDH